MILPKRRDKIRSGIERGPRREWPRHRKFLRGFHCVVPGCEDSPIECCHVRVTNGTGTGGGTGVKPHDAFSVPMCSAHHRRSHQIGGVTFEDMHRIDLLKLAAEFVKASPDTAMKDEMKAWGLL